MKDSEITEVFYQIARLLEKQAKSCNLLKHSRLSAGEICNHFSISDAAVSRHLSVLKDADLIRDEREGKFIYYELNASVLEEIILWISELKGEDDYDQTT